MSLDYFRSKCQPLVALNISKYLTLKNEAVDPEPKHPYLMRLCFAKSSTLSIGESILSIVKNAAKLAVYDEIMIRVKNRQKLATVRDDIAL